MGLYGSIPYLMAHRKGMSVGVLWVNSSEMWVDMERDGSADENSKTSGNFNDKTTSSKVHWMAESGIVDLFFLLGPTQQDVLNQLTTLTGRPAMPQSFALGYHQCRWNYKDEKDVSEVDAGFDHHGIPYDVLWLDIEHTAGKRYFTWDPKNFPTPVRMQEELAAKRRKMVTIIDPHIRADESYYVFKEARDKDLFVKGRDGKDFEGVCWPDISRWIDYTNPDARRYWSELFKYDRYMGSTPSLYTWNDMNEFSNLPNVPCGGWEHRDVHNAYEMLQHRSTFEGHLLRSENNDRPFVLSRSFFIGSQKYGPIWTGDNVATWEHLKASVPMLLTLGMSGIPFVGADIGGFFKDPSPELITRWYQLGAFQPFFRGHAHIDMKRREPWLFGEPYTTVIRDAISERYKILPYMYTCHFEAARKGVPVMRPMVFAFPEDKRTFSMDDQFMLGPALLIKPVTREDQNFVDVYLPPTSTWYNYKTFEQVRPYGSTLSSDNSTVSIKTPLDTIPVLLRGGAIIARREVMRKSSTAMQGDPVTLLVALDDEYKAKGSLYFDDGKSYQHEKGQHVFLEFTVESLITNPKRSVTNSKLLLTATRLRVPEWESPCEGGPEDDEDEERKIRKLGARVERILLVAPSVTTTTSSSTEEKDAARPQGFFVVKGSSVVFDGPVWNGDGKRERWKREIGLLRALKTGEAETLANVAE
ncbi:hypothetical protein HK102_000853, partial [Quaeritorhiza haematococci]